MLLKIEEKLSLTLFVFLSAFAASWKLHGALLLLLLALRTAFPPLRPLTAQGNRRFWKLFWYFVLLSSAMVLVNGVLLREGPVLFRFLAVDVYANGLLFGLQTGSRLLMLIISLLVFFGSTPMKAIAGFLHRIGLPDQIVMTFLLTLYFLDQLPVRIERIFTAQEARGAPVRATMFGRSRAFFVILRPLILSSVAESIDRGMALELRGFHGKASFARSPHDSNTGGITPFTIVFLVLSFATILWIILQLPLP